jgi:MFS family permease
LGTLYDYVTGDEDARVCKDIPEHACDDLPHNFFAYLGANLIGKISDELGSAKLVLPWTLSALGAPAAIAGFLVPVRESGVLLPQLIVAAYIRHLAVRKWVWVLGAVSSAAAMAVMALAALTLDGVLAGWAILGLLVLYSLARGLCSVSAKDVLGKTVSKARRGALMGYSAGLSGAATVLIGLYIQFYRAEVPPRWLPFSLLACGALLWLVATVIFIAIRERPGATEGGGNALHTALNNLNLVRTDSGFRRFVTARAALLSVSLVQPFFVILAQQRTAGSVAGLGMLIIASGLAGSLSAPVWGKLSDRSSRRVMAMAAAASGTLGIGVWAMVMLEPAFAANPLTYALLFLALGVFYSGVRLARKVYLVDMSTQQTRAAYVAVSNTLVGVVMLAGGAFGFAADVLGVSQVILALSILSLLAAAYAWRLPEVSG